MAELNLFRYCAGDSPLHRMDPRCKLIGLILISLTVSAAQRLSAVILVSVFLAWNFRRSRLRWAILGLEIRRFGFLLAVILAARSWGNAGSAAGLPGFSRAGFVAGLLFDWRLVAVLVAGLLLVATTPLTELRKALLWFLRPLPRAHAARLGTMFGLTFALVPLLLEQADAVREAQAARGSESVRNPFRRLISLAWPILRETFRRADELILAMEARCYNEEQHSRPQFQSQPADWRQLGMVLALMLLVLVLQIGPR